MLLKNLMEDKQLDFNQPLLSVRRFSSTGVSSEAEIKGNTDKSLPKIPPLPVYKSELKSGPIRNPGTVPFLWEQIPGRPKYDSKSQTRSIERPPIAPKLPPGRISNIKQQALDKGPEVTNSKLSHKGTAPSTSQSVSSSDKNTTKCEGSIEGIEETESSSTEGGDEAYMDALDTLSRTESFFFNCSVTGVGGLDDLEVKPSGTFSTDPQTRDFMMGRFLPAAKAMASEAPHYTNRKQPIAQEQPRNIQRIVNTNKRPPPKQYDPHNLSFHAHDKKLEESDDEDDYERPGNSSAAVCGLLPRFCMKSSFCLLNPVPGMRLQAREPINLVHREPTRHATSSGDLPVKAKNSKVNDPDPQRKVTCNFRELLANESTECKSDLASPVEKTLYIDSVHKVKSPKSNAGSSDTKKLSDLQGDGFDALIKSGETEAARSVDTSPQCIKLLNVISEKATPRPKGLEAVDSNFLSTPDNAIIGQNIGAKSSSTEDLSNNWIKLGSPKVDGSGKIDLESQLHMKLSNQERSRGLILNSTSTSSKMAADGKTNIKCHPKMEFSSQEGSLGSYSQLPLSLPPPKSPSDSWLKRTLPTVSMKNSSSWSALGTYNSTRVQTSKTPHVDPKWETIVKTSNVQHGHLHFSEERLTTIPEN